MSDIQRYEQQEKLMYKIDWKSNYFSNTETYVKYDDHIAEVEKLQARIDELEKALYNPKWERCEARIKAEGIREMLLDCMATKPETDEYGVPTRYVDIDNIEQYADQLEKDDE